MSAEALPERNPANGTVYLGDFAKYALDLDKVEWTASYVEPGTPYDDEDSEFVPVGWWVRGRWVDMDSCDPSPYNLHIDWAYDEEGFDVTESLARRIADSLNGDRYEIELDRVSRLLPLWRGTVTNKRTGQVVDRPRILVGADRAHRWASAQIDAQERLDALQERLKQATA